MFRGLRVLRVLTVMQLLNRSGSRAIQGKIWVYITTVMIFVGAVAALAVLDAERGAPDSSITTFSDALWWAVTTMSTVGYGDTFVERLHGAEDSVEQELAREVKQLRSELAEVRSTGAER